MTLHRKLRLARISRTFYYTPLWIAIERGMFGQCEMDVDVQEIGDASVATRGLRDGTIDISLAPPDGVLADHATGGRLRIIAGNANRLSHSLIALPRYKSVADLKGARIGCISLTEGSTFHFQKIAAAHGLHSGDYMLEPVGGAPTRHKLLLEGAIDAGLQSVPFTFMEEEAGLNNLATASDYVPNYQFNSINVNDEWASNNRKTVEEFLAVLRDATLIMYGEKAAAADVASRNMGIERRYAERAWDEFTDTHVIPKDLGINFAGLDEVAALMRAAGALPQNEAFSPRECVDMSYRDAILA